MGCGASPPITVRKSFLGRLYKIVGILMQLIRFFLDFFLFIFTLEILLHLTFFSHIILFQLKPTVLVELFLLTL